MFYELMGLIWQQSVPRVYRLCIPMKNSSYASLQTFHHPLTPSSVYFDRVLKFSGLFHTQRIWLVSCETLSKTNTETCNFSMCRYSWDYARNYECISPVSWILDSTDPILGEWKWINQHTGTQLLNCNQDKQYKVYPNQSIYQRAYVSMLNIDNGSTIDNYFLENDLLT